LHANRECIETIASFKKGDFNHALPDVAVGCGGVEAVLSEHVGVELGDGYHGGKVVVELRSEVSGAASDAVLEVFLALDLVFEAHCNLESKVVDGSRHVAVNLVLEPVDRGRENRKPR
jgi:hypothetical protein